MGDLRLVKTQDGGGSTIESGLFKRDIILVLQPRGMVINTAHAYP